MKRSIIAGTATFALVAAGGAAGAAATGIVHVHSGDRVIVDRNLGCFVGSSDIVCGGAGTAKISADVRSNGEIVVQFDPTPHGTFPALFVERAVCSAATGTCRLVTKHP